MDGLFFAVVMTRFKNHSHSGFKKHAAARLQSAQIGFLKNIRRKRKFTVAGLPGWLWPGMFIAWIISFSGCSTSERSKPLASGNPETVFASPTGLTAALTNGNNVVLHWKNNATADGGNWVEYTTAGYEYIKLDAFASDDHVTSYLHKNLAPRTTLIYRLQPFFGRPTKPVAIATGVGTNDATVLAEGPITSTNANSSGGKNSMYSIRSLQTFAQAAPTDLTAARSSPTAVDLHWRNHATDADGSLLEVSARPGGDFVPCALLPPEAAGFRKTGLPPHTKCYFRVRAFFYGKPSNTASATTR